LAVIRDKAVVRKVFNILGPRFKDRPGGYTRTVKIGLRRGDNAPLSLIEVIPEQEVLEAEPTSTASKRKRRPTARKGRPKKEAEPEAAA
jgi:large subunit ribosomal protein L17